MAKIYFKASLFRVEKVVIATARYWVMKTLPIVLISFNISAVPAETADEIAHLIAFVHSTQCRYKRNGDKYNGAAAAAHIQKKYAYYGAEVTSAEMFIELSATKSTMSGKYYLVYCPEQPAVKSADWLLQELLRYRGEKIR